MHKKYYFKINKYYDTLEKAIEDLKLPKDVPEDEVYITVCSVDFKYDDDYSYSVELNIWLNEYEDTFRTNIFEVEDNMLLDPFGSAGEDEIDPLKTIDRCVQACVDKAEAYIEMWEEEDKFNAKEVDVNVL